MRISFYVMGVIGWCVGNMTPFPLPAPPASMMKLSHNTALPLGACSNCLHTCLTGHWPLTGHRIIKSYLTGFLLPARHDLLWGGHLRCAVPVYNKKSRKYSMLSIGGKVCFPNDQKVSLRCPLVFCIALWWLRLCNLLCQRRTLSSCSWSVCNKRADFLIRGGRTLIWPAT